jgi:von Willebrand factor type A domain
MRRSIIGLGAIGVLTILGGCSSSDANPAAGSQSGTGGGLIFGTGGSDGGSAGSGGGAAGSSAGTSGTTSGGGAAGSCPVTVNDAGCTGELYVGETIPLDIYVMFDQSGSMLNQEQGGVTRMDAVRNAVDAFLHDPQSAGMGVGIGYFGYEQIGQTTCDQVDYANPDVTVGVLPDNAQAIVDSLAGRQPTGETPSGAAIRGACSYAKAWKLAHPGHETVILLVTDGKPEAPVTCNNGSGPCCPTLPDAVAAATDCLNGKPGLKTYVLGVGPLLDNLGQIAAAGGTDKAYLVSGGDVTSQVLAALNAIRAAASIPCELQIPPPPSGQTLNLDKVNVVYTTNTCQTQVVSYRDSQASCDNTSGGWFFDNASAPQKVLLCGKTCDNVSVPGGQLLFSVGCGRISIH